MMQLISMATCTHDFAEGYVEIEKEYLRFNIVRGKEPVIHARFKKSEFRNYRHFAGVIGKFDPYAFILSKPIELNCLDLDELVEIYKNTPELRRFD
jgi:hypothetical protein